MCGLWLLTTGLVPPITTNAPEALRTMPDISRVSPGAGIDDQGIERPVWSANELLTSGKDRRLPPTA